jgi:hypothetical protein
MAQQTATTAVGLDLCSDDGLDGTIGFDGIRLRRASPAEGLMVSNAITPVGRKGHRVSPAGRAVSGPCAAGG